MSTADDDDLTDDSGDSHDPPLGPRLTPELGGRLRSIREEIYGKHGAPMLAEALGITSRGWLEAESQGEIAPDILLRFLVLTGAHPHWLLTGVGPVYLKRMNQS